MRKMPEVPAFFLPVLNILTVINRYEKGIKAIMKKYPVTPQSPLNIEPFEYDQLV
jgi:hypothetical protein